MEDKEIYEYLKRLGVKEENIPSLLEYFQKELANITVTIVDPKGKWSKDIEEKESLGIPDSDFGYHMIFNNQNRREEVFKTQEFLTSLISKVPHIITPTANIEFINYGDTELVYVSTEEDSRYTILVGQPIVKLGSVKLEYENLKHLASKNPQLVVSPIAYVNNECRECYITPYINQARCIASYGSNYGAYVPEPYYRFEPFTEEDEYLITKTIIANLIRLYDEEHNLALAECKIGGGDFIMEKEFDNIAHTEENALKHMKLIAARKLINIEIKEYIKLLKKEFTQRTYYRTIEEKDPNIYINLKNRVPMNKQAIEDGISLGLTFKKNPHK